MDFSLRHFIYSDHRGRYLICFHNEKYFNPGDEFLVFSNDSDDPQIEPHELNVTNMNGPFRFQQKVQLHFSFLMGKWLHFTGNIIPINPTSASLLEYVTVCL